MKKLSVNLIAGKTIKRRPKQYIATVICIVLSMIFSSGILFFLSSLNATQEEDYYRRNGKQDVFMFVTREEADKYLTNKSVIESFGIIDIVAQAITEDELSFAVATMDEKAKEISYIIFLQGRYPEKENEIAMELNTLLSFGYDETYLNKKITLNMKPQNGETVIENMSAKEYTLVGIAQDKLNTHFQKIVPDEEYVAERRFSIPTVFVADSTLVEAGGKARTAAYIKTAIPNFTDEFFNWETESFGATKGYSYYDEYADYNYQFSKTGASSSFNFAVVICGLLLAASCAAIVNTFASQLNDRKKQIGMLRTVGATKKQIINIYGRETFLLCLVCTPLSVVISYFATKLILPRIYSAAVIRLEIPVLLGCAALGIAVVMAAAMLPLISASRVSPVQSVRNISMNRKMKNKKIKSQSRFDTSTLLAKRGLTFSVGRRVIVSILLVITIFTSSFGFALVKLISSTEPITDIGDYSIRSHIYTSRSYTNVRFKNSGFTENDRNEILSSPYVSHVTAWVDSTCAVISTPTANKYLEAVDYTRRYQYEYDTEMRQASEKSQTPQFKYVRDTLGIANPYVSILCAADSSTAEKLDSMATEGQLNMNSFLSGEEVILVVPKTIYVYDLVAKEYGDKYLSTNYYEYPSSNRYEELTELMREECNLKVGDALDLRIITEKEGAGDPIKSADEVEQISTQVKIGAIILVDESNINDLVTQFEFGINKTEINIITSAAALQSWGKDVDYTELYIHLDRECDDQIEEYMQAFLQDITLNKNTGSMGIYSAYASYKDELESAKNMEICLVGVIILFLAISASLIANSLGAKIRSGKREIGTLRAVGADTATITKIYIRQLLSIFGVGYGAGFGLVGLVYLGIFIYEKVKDTQLGMPFEIWQTLIGCAVLFAVCSINLWLKIRKEAKNSIIENIREIE